ncbi:hypothetical protein DL766_003643 [Monosporascus sp. MC13-8B]|uniref:Peptidase A1 domain-containing protein n=1 Tax=Monosporascus cannonballus TaxID=155416 RepID=A0ABY0HAN4_9PEZI|nr:hypothetical protein DL762_004928 [Monosporascus cannonballus]RYO91566.1 hypothetical protein DL763_004947 [Monosporascus cannonballus]RYP33143.1 hypothetical protein DL766_003643 [Monosporascus sp. MC13-8B]
MGNRMRFIVCSLLASFTNAQVVQWDIARGGRLGLELGARQARSIEEVVTNDKLNGGYFTTCKIGTPGQDVTLQLDTGSSDTWVPATSSGICTKSSSSRGCVLGSYSAGDSSSFEDAGKGDFSITYVDGSKANGDYFTDVFEIGDAAIPDMTIGLGLETNIPYGIVGVGYALNEATKHFIYPNLPIRMQHEGLITTIAYSLWLNDLDASTGNILFGGIDTEKYKGDLTRINIYVDPRTGGFTSFRVALTSVRAISDSGSDALSSKELPISVVLDSGTTLSYLPTDLVSQIWEEVGALYSNDVGGAIIPCSRATSTGYFSFGFAGPGGPVINLTMDELVLPLTLGENQPLFEFGPYEGQEACRFGVQSSSSEPYLLGDTFLRSAYVVYDLYNNEIGMAVTDFNATGSNVVPFEGSGARIPSATVAPNQDSIWGTGSPNPPTYGASNGFHEDRENSVSASAACEGFNVALVLLGAVTWSRFA